MFVNVFGGITACDAVANGIVKALQILGGEANKPLVVRLDGNNVERGPPHPDRGQPPARDIGGDDGRSRRHRGRLSGRIQLSRRSIAKD